MRLNALLKLAEVFLVAKTSQFAGKELIQSAVSYIVVLLVGMVTALVSAIAAIGLIVAGLIAWAIGYPQPLLFVLGGTAAAMVGIAGITWYIVIRAKTVSRKVNDMLHQDDILSGPQTDPLQMGKDLLENILPREFTKLRSAFQRGWDRAAQGPLH